MTVEGSRPRDKSLKAIDLAPEGLTLSRALAGRLSVNAGDTVTVDVLEGRRTSREVEVAAMVDDVLGMSAYMDLAALNRMTGDGDVVSAAQFYVEPHSVAALGRRFKELPIIESVTMKASAVSAFIDKVAAMVLVSAAILFGEFAMEIALGIPVGLWLSQIIVEIIARFGSNDSFQIPAVIEPRTFIAASGLTQTDGTHLFGKASPQAIDLVGRFVQTDGYHLSGSHH